jgi:hypothetical protein
MSGGLMFWECLRTQLGRLNSAAGGNLDPHGAFRWNDSAGYPLLNCLRANTEHTSKTRLTASKVASPLNGGLSGRPGSDSHW